MPSLASALMALCCLGGAISCASSAPAPEPSPTEEITQAGATDVAPAQEPAKDPDAFCAPGERVYTMQNYRWCKKGDQIDGNFTRVDEEGGVRLVGQFSDGALVGTWKAFYPNGTPAWQMDVEQGEESGEVLHWYEDGTPRAQIRYKKGVRDGVSEYFYPNGAKLAHIEYTQGKPTGEWTYWHENGQKSHEYTKGAKGQAGIHKHWKPDGKKYIAPVGQLPKSALLPMLESLGPMVRTCFDDLRVMSDAQGKVVMQITMGYGGEVSQLDMFDSSFGHPYMGLCARRMGEQLQFPHNPYGPRQLLRSWEFSVE